jgi:predicted Zn-dependent peptidase
MNSIEPNPITGEKSVRHDRAHISQLDMGWRYDSVYDKGFVAAKLIQALLVTSPASVLNSRLVERSICQWITVRDYLNKLGSYFVIEAYGSGDHPLHSIYSIILSEIEKVSEKLITDREYERVKNHYMIELVKGIESVRYKARSSNLFNYFVNNANQLNKILEIIGDIGKNDILLTSQKMLGEKDLVSLEVLPRKS